MNAETNDLNQKNLVAELREGKERAFQQIYLKYYRPVCYFAYNLVNDMSQAEDIASETFSKLWVLRQNFNEMPSVKSFLYTAARNASLNYLKSLKVRTTTHDELLYLAENEEDFVLSKIIRAQLLQSIYCEVERFPDKVREVFRLFFEEGLGTREIALRLDMPEQSVRNTKTRALDMLRHTLLRKKVLYMFALLAASH